jgi:hypothetical protein
MQLIFSDGVLMGLIRKGVLLVQRVYSSGAVTHVTISYLSRAQVHSERGLQYTQPQ